VEIGKETRRFGKFWFQFVGEPTGVVCGHRGGRNSNAEGKVGDDQPGGYQGKGATKEKSKRVKDPTATGSWSWCYRKGRERSLKKKGNAGTQLDLQQKSQGKEPPRGGWKENMGDGSWRGVRKVTWKGLGGRATENQNRKTWWGKADEKKENRGRVLKKNTKKASDMEDFCR